MRSAKARAIIGKRQAQVGTLPGQPLGKQRSECTSPIQALDVTRWGGSFGCATLIPPQSEGSHMPRRPRLDLPGVAQHVVQRG